VKALVPTTVEVPLSLQTAPFDHDRVLMVPPRFSISVVARIPAARFIVPLSTGEILVARPATGSILVIRPQANGMVGVSTLIDGLSYAQGMALHPSGDRLYLYVGESKQVSRFNLAARATSADDKRVIVPIARGIRNAEGLAFVPGTNELWAAVNESDDVRYPFRNSWQGSGSNDYGKRITSYIDDHPPDEFIHVKEGANYGWPFADPNPGTPNGFDQMPFAPNYETNPDWSKYPESMFTRVDKGIQAHSAPLGMAFLQDSKTPEPFREGIAIALHGSWDRSRKTGYKVIFFPWQGEGPGRQFDLVTGWLDDHSQSYWGRPVDVKPANDGSLLISDDYSGTIYRLALRHGP
jgi:glucose/arabinose dehydrogenase